MPEIVFTTAKKRTSEHFQNYIRRQIDRVYAVFLSKLSSDFNKTYCGGEHFHWHLMQVYAQPSVSKFKRAKKKLVSNFECKWHSPSTRNLMPIFFFKHLNFDTAQSPNVKTQVRQLAKTLYVGIHT